MAFKRPQVALLFCPQCNRDYRGKGALAKHIDSAHGFSCTFRDVNSKVVRGVPYFNNKGDAVRYLSDSNTAEAVIAQISKLTKSDGTLIQDVSQLVADILNERAQIRPLDLSIAKTTPDHENHGGGNPTP